MDLSYLKSRTIVNVEPAANFGGGWMLKLGFFNGRVHERNQAIRRNEG